MNKIKVLQFPIANAKGGITQYALRNWTFTDKTKFQYDFATLSKKLDFEDELISQGCKVHYISCYAEENEKQFNKEINKIFDEGYDAVHLHTSYWKSFIVEQIAMERKVPVVIVHSHSTMIDIADDIKRNDAIKLHEEKKRLFSNDLATHFCACSELAADWLFGEQIPKSKIKILKNAIDTDFFAYNIDIRNKYRQELGLDGCFVLGNAGRFVYPKNHEFLINVFRLICDKITNARLLLIGDGKLKDSIIRKAKSYGIDEKILFMGFRSDVNNLMQAMDVFLLPSKFEGLGLVLIEAQTSGLKCLASSNVPYEAKITPNLEYLPYEADEWCSKILEYYNGYDRKNYSDMVSEAGFSLKNQIKVLEKLYQN